MRTTDFSAAPAQAQGGSMFIGATRYSGLRSIVTLSRTWYKMLAQMKRMQGYRWHTVYYEFPLTLGTIAIFDDRDAMMRFARSKHHRELMCWLTDNGTRNATAGFIRLYDAVPEGYTNGLWRAEDGRLGHVERFTALSTEAGGPPVHRT